MATTKSSKPKTAPARWPRSRTSDPRSSSRLEHAEHERPRAHQALWGKEIQVPFGFITSESTADQKAAAVSAGASFLLSKPFTADELGAQLARFL
ncbi:MAG: hypothetical protein R2710_09260 [Acidimicrobiales bacterium]